MSYHHYKSYHTEKSYHPDKPSLPEGLVQSDYFDQPPKLAELDSLFNIDDPVNINHAVKNKSPIKLQITMIPDNLKLAPGNVYYSLFKAGL